MIMIKHLHNPELEKHYRAELASFAKLIKSVSQYCTNRQDLSRLLADPEKFTLQNIQGKFPEIEKLGLTFRKLCNLYDIDFETIQILAAQLNGHEYLNLLHKADLKLDPKKVETHVEANAITVLTETQSQVYEVAERLAIALNKLTRDLSQQGKQYDLSKIITLKAGLQQWEANRLWILNFIDSRL